MHELSIAQSMIEQLENNSLLHGFGKISFALIEIGNIACIMYRVRIINVLS